MDGESILYIIIAIIYFAVSAIGSRNKAKKKKARQEAARRAAEGRQPESREDMRKQEDRRPPVQEEQEQEEQPTFQDIFEELFGEGKRPRPEPEPVQNIPTVEPVHQPEDRESRSRRTDKPRIKTRELDKKQRELAEKFRRNAGLDKKKKKRTRYSKTGHVLDSLTLRDAIIAKAILDRPYE